MPADRESLLRRAAKWLQRLHANFAEDVHNLDAVEKSQLLSKRWSLVPHPNRFVLDGLECLKAIGSSIESNRIRRVWLHGDFKPENLLFDGQKIVGLDCGLRNRNAAIYDIAPFLNHLVLDSRGLRDYGPRRQLSALEEAFLDSYFEHGPRNVQAILWARLFFMLSYWCTRVERRRLLRPLYDLYFGPLVASLTNRLVKPRSGGA